MQELSEFEPLWKRGVHFCLGLTVLVAECVAGVWALKLIVPAMIE